MELNRSTRYTCNLVSKSYLHILIDSLNLYEQKLLILEYLQIAHPRRNMSLRFNYSIGPSVNESNLPNQPCLSNEYLK